MTTQKTTAPDTLQALKREHALAREVRSKRSAVSYTASEVGARAVRWEPGGGWDTALAELKAELAKLNEQVDALADLHNRVLDGSWEPRPEDL